MKKLMSDIDKALIAVRIKQRIARLKMQNIVDKQK